jgi:crotonobetainyl-CoA:carnitine CoA-transferase CaiB-like acyl-CoA transferase
MRSANGPLAGIRVLELGSSVAGPFCGRLMADFGAEVVKVEAPQGDPLRTMSKRVDGESLYATTILRNKRLVAIDLRSDDGRKLVREMARHCDILIENFRPGVLEQWGLSYEELSRDNPGIILVRISGFGQSGPYRERAGYGVIGEAMSGLRHLTGDPDRPPARINASVTDEVTAMYAALGAMMALHERTQSGRGQIVDAALYESAFSLIEPHVPVYGALNLVPKREGSRLPDSTPNNLFESRDGRHIHITAMADSVFRRLAEAMGQPELADDARFRTAEIRSDNADAIDDIIAKWAALRDLTTLEATLAKAGVPASRIYDMADIYADPHYRAREMLVELPHPRLGKVTVSGVVPKLSETPGKVRQAGGAIGDDTRDVLADWCKLSTEEIDALEKRGVVATAHASAPA